MNIQDIKKVLDAFAANELTNDAAAERLKGLAYEDVGYAKIDHNRASRQGFPEVIFGQGKTNEQIVGIFEKLIERSPNVLIIRVLRDDTERGIGEIAIVTAGTSDIPVAEEAALTAEAMGNRVVRIWDAGVAGIHRIISQREVLQNARVVIVAAGMEGALPSVVGGLVSVPVIGVPTSVGYGASFGGIAALLGMLNSCSSNVTVVNIDNGFGAGFTASLINRKA